MITHFSLGKTAYSRAKALNQLISTNKICFGWNAQLKIYGLLNSKSAKRLKLEERVLFSSEKEAIDFGYRPCGHCMKKNYERWKNSKPH